LIGLETLAFVDLALFEEELTLFGTIGTGISLSLAQCEEQEGCAPSVTEDELNTIIATLKARVEELERRLVDEESKGDDSVQDELESLIERFNLELAEFQDYLSEVQAFFAVDEELEEDGFGEEGLEEDGFLDGETSADEVTKLAGVLETIQERIQWLESLKGQADERARLSQITGIELTQETLDSLIEAAKSEAAFIENRIRLLLESPQANSNAPSIFTAEARSYDSTHILHYGTDLLQLPGNNDLNIF